MMWIMVTAASAVGHGEQQGGDSHTNDCSMVIVTPCGGVQCTATSVCYSSCASSRVVIVTPLQHQSATVAALVAAADLDHGEQQRDVISIRYTTAALG
jgi:hypothetical protein